MGIILLGPRRIQTRFCGNGGGRCVLNVHFTKTYFPQTNGAFTLHIKTNVELTTKRLLNTLCCASVVHHLIIILH